MSDPVITDYSAKAALLEYTTSRITKLHESLESPMIDQRIADYYRGQIAILKQIKEQLSYNPVKSLYIGECVCMGRR